MADPSIKDMKQAILDEEVVANDLYLRGLNVEELKHLYWVAIDRRYKPGGSGFKDTEKRFRKAAGQKPKHVPLKKHRAKIPPRDPRESHKLPNANKDYQARHRQEAERHYPPPRLHGVMPSLTRQERIQLARKAGLRDRTVRDRHLEVALPNAGSGYRARHEGGHRNLFCD